MPYKDSEAQRAYHAAYRAARREHARQYASQWYSDPLNRERRYEYNRARRDITREYDARRRAENPEKKRSQDVAYAAKRRRAPGRLSSSDVRAIRQMADGVCAYCLKPSDSLELEHCTPLSRGGWNSPDNCVMACRACNARKHMKTVLEFCILNG